MTKPASFPVRFAGSNKNGAFVHSKRGFILVQPDIQEQANGAEVFVIYIGKLGAISIMLHPVLFFGYRNKAVGPLQRGCPGPLAIGPGAGGLEKRPVGHRWPA